MAKTRQGKEVAPGVLQLKTSAPGGMRKIRCPRCQNLAVPARLPDGTQVLKCQTCSINFTTKKF